MKEQKNIDRLFQEQFKDFDAKPSSKVWSGIEAKLKEDNERKPFIIPMWYKLAGVAAVVALVFFVGRTLIFNEQTNPVVEIDQNQVTPQSKNPELTGKESDTSETPIPAEKATPQRDALTFNEQEVSSTNAANTNLSDTEGSSPETERYANTTALEAGDATLTGASTNSKNTTGSETAISATTNVDPLKANQEVSETIAATEKANAAIQTSEATRTESTSEENTRIAETTTTSKENPETGSEDTNTGVALENTNSLLEETLKQETFLEDKEFETDIEQRWAISPYAAPIYYDGAGSGSSIDPQLSDNESQGEVTLAYGVNVSYAINKRLKIRSGVTKVTHSYNTNEIAFGPTASSAGFQTISQSKSQNGLKIAVFDASVGSPILQNPSILGSSDVFGRNLQPRFEGSLNQTLGYIEVPVELEYAVINNRFGVNLFGGASTLFLDENSISVISDNERNEIGQANNANTVSFSTNIGLGLNYKLTKTLKLNLEPTFKYQINTFSDGSDFNPYYLGLYTGFSFKF